MQDGFMVKFPKLIAEAEEKLECVHVEYKEEMSTSPVGCMTRLENLFNGIQGTIGFLEERLEKYRLDMEQAKIEYEKPFQYEEELKTKLTRQFELNNLLDMENQKETEEEHSLEE